MVYQIKNMLLNVTQELSKGDVNDVVICQDLSAVTKIFYTVLIIKKHEVAKRLLKIYEKADSERTYVTKGTYKDNYLMVYPYDEERRLKNFFGTGIYNMVECEKLCSEIVIECVTSKIPYPIMYLQLLQNRINISRYREIYFSYTLDLKELSETIGEKECVTICAKTIFSLLDKVMDEDNVSYTLIKKKIKREGYTQFIDLYKDIQAATLTLERRNIGVRVKAFFEKNRERIFRTVLVICLTVGFIALIMLLSQLIFGDIVFYRFFINTFKKIGTESLV